jgi:hypothetical protein
MKENKTPFILIILWLPVLLLNIIVKFSGIVLYSPIYLYFLLIDV